MLRLGKESELNVMLELTDCPVIISLARDHKIRADLKEVLRNDYYAIPQLFNKADVDMERAYFVNKKLGQKRLHRVVSKCLKFNRDLIILYESTEHRKIIEELIHGSINIQGCQ